MLFVIIVFFLTHVRQHYQQFFHSRNQITEHHLGHVRYQFGVVDGRSGVHFKQSEQLVDRMRDNVVRGVLENVEEHVQSLHVFVTTRKPSHEAPHLRQHLVVSDARQLLDDLVGGQRVLFRQAADLHERVYCRGAVVQ